MNTGIQKSTAAQEANIIPLVSTATPKSKREASRHRQRFALQDFINQATGTRSLRVTGYKRDGARVRENFADLKAAQCRQVELEMEYLARETNTAIRATELTDTQLRLAETAYVRLHADHELMLAVDHWLKHGRQNAVAESPRLDDAVKAFEDWLKTATLRERSKGNLRVRVNVFANSIGNSRVSDITPEAIDIFLDKRCVSAASKDNDRRAVSRFFSWCMDRKRRWTAVNPCRAVKVDQGEKAPPAVLTVADCEALLRKAESFNHGRLAPYLAVCLFAGLRPFEAQRLTWPAVNLADGEIRLEGIQTKTGNSRVVSICDTLCAWLRAYKGKPFFPSNWRKQFDEVKQAGGYGTPDAKHPDLKPWPVDVLRHTAISHYFRHTGSYGRTAEWAGNSEQIIKRHYQGRVSSEDTRSFYALLPKKGGRK